MIDKSDIPTVAMPFMQATHMEEVALLNELYLLFEAYEAGQHVPDLAEKIEALSSHTDAHFKREEESMVALGFPPYPIHKQAHDDYLNDFNAVLADWRSSGDLAALMLFLKETTPAWMIQHISTMDVVTANFFAMCEND